MSSDTASPNPPGAAPFFTAPGAPIDGPRLLLVSYHFPPGQAVGALRWEKLAALAAERGWGVDVITEDPAALPSQDPSRLQSLPPGTRLFAVHRRPLGVDRVVDGALDRVRGLRGARKPSAGASTGATGSAQGASSTPKKSTASSLSADEMRWPLLRRADWTRAYNAWRNYTWELGWARAAAEIGRALTATRPYAAVASCGPPHIAAHSAGEEIARAAGLPLVVDLRDPWAIERRLPESFASPLALQLAERVEHRVVPRASLVVANTDPVRDMMRRKYPASRVVTVMNGYDDEAIPAVEKAPRFTLAYAGAIYLDRDPRPLLKGAARVIRELALTPNDFAIEMIGNVENYGGVPLSVMAQQEGIAPYVHSGGRRPRREALEFLARAQMLVSLPQDSHSAVPSKVFEFMLFDAWMLALADAGSATEVVLRDTAVDVVPPGDEAAIAAVLRRRYEQHARGERPRRAAEERFSRRAQGAVLFDALEEIVGARGGLAPRAASATGAA